MVKKEAYAGDEATVSVAATVCGNTVLIGEFGLLKVRVV
jgi:hypothetical protein